MFLGPCDTVFICRSCGQVHGGSAKGVPRICSVCEQRGMCEPEDMDGIRRVERVCQNPNCILDCSGHSLCDTVFYCPSCKQFHGGTINGIPRICMTCGCRKDCAPESREGVRQVERICENRECILAYVFEGDVPRSKT